MERKRPSNFLLAFPLAFPCEQRRPPSSLGFRIPRQRDLSKKNLVKILGTKVFSPLERRMNPALTVKGSSRDPSLLRRAIHPPLPRKRRKKSFCLPYFILLLGQTCLWVLLDHSPSLLQEETVFDLNL